MVNWRLRSGVDAGEVGGASGLCGLRGEANIRAPPGCVVQHSRRSQALSTATGQYHISLGMDKNVIFISSQMSTPSVKPCKNYRRSRTELYSKRQQEPNEEVIPARRAKNTTLWPCTEGQQLQSHASLADHSAHHSQDSSIPNKGGTCRSAFCVRALFHAGRVLVSARSNGF